MMYKNLIIKHSFLFIIISINLQAHIIGHFFQQHSKFYLFVIIARINFSHALLMFYSKWQSSQIELSLNRYLFLSISIHIDQSLGKPLSFCQIHQILLRIQSRYHSRMIPIQHAPYIISSNDLQKDYKVAINFCCRSH